MDVGRIFFNPPYKPEAAVVVPLRSHTGSVVALVKAWDDQRTYRGDCSQLERTRPQLIEAAARHDEAKPDTFRVTEEGGRWGYSFSGHRFRVACDDLYVDALIKMHHEFSVEGVAEWQARLRRELGTMYADNFPFDLYTLEMCDQVAAEAESYAFQGHADERAFMELHSRKRADGSVEIEPFPFVSSPHTLMLGYVEIEITKDLRDAKKLTERLGEWQPVEYKERTVMLCSP